MSDEPTPTPEANSEVTSEATTAEPTPVPAPPPPAEPASVPVVSPAPKSSAGGGATFVWGTGRRKASVARVRIKPGAGKFEVNKREVTEFFCLEKDRCAVRRPLQVTDAAEAFDVFVNVQGGGTTGQAGAVALGLARALLKANADHEPKLRESNLLTRDARRVERKKPGRRKARRSFQFSKR